MARIIDQQKKNLIGEQVRFYRIQRGYSQQQLADKLETIAVYICRGSISRIEDYSRTVTDLELVALAEVLQVSVLDLLPESLFAQIHFSQPLYNYIIEAFFYIRQNFKFHHPIFSIFFLTNKHFFTLSEIFYKTVAISICFFRFVWYNKGCNEILTWRFFL